MPIDISEVVREVLTNALQGVGGSSDGKRDTASSNGGRSGLKGLAAGAGAAAIAPIALKKLGGGLGIDGLEDVVKSPGESLQGAVSQIGERLTSGAKDKAKEAVGGEGGPGEMVKDAAKGMLPGGGGGKSGKQDAQGVGKGRRMPIQQSVDVALPVETVYNQWTQFEEWPKFMHRVTRASQEDPCKVNFSTKIWGKTKEFTAEIETQRPNDRIKWKTSQGMNVTGVVAFRELGPNLTRIILSFDVGPGSLIEKYARGVRYVKRAARADLHRFVAFIEMLENETGAWRGVIEDGELVEDHDPSYDAEREYGDADELVHGRGADEDEDEDSADEDEDSGGPGGEQRQRRSSGSRQGASSRRGGRSSQAQSRSGGSSSRSAGGRSSGGRKSSGRSSNGNGSSSRSGSGRTSSGSSSSRRSSGGSTSGRNSGGSRGRSSSGSTSGRGSGSSGSSGGGSRGSSRAGSSSRSSSGRSSGSSSGGSRSSGRTRSRGSSQSSRSSASKGQGRSRTGSSRRG